MSNQLRDRKASRNKPAKDRRAAQEGRDALRWLKGLMARPIVLERRGRGVHLVLIDRRQAPAPDNDASLTPLRAELRTRLVAHEVAHAAKVMRHLGFVHDQLGRGGWPAVAALPTRLLGNALLQAEMLAEREPSPALQLVIDRLRLLSAEASQRDDRESRRPEFVVGEDLDVCESTHEEFEETERSWAGTVPPGLVLPERGK